MLVNQSVLKPDAIMSGHQEACTFYINNMKIHRIRIHIAAPQEPQLKVQLKL